MSPAAVIAQITDPHIGVGPGDAGACRRLEGVVAAVAAIDPTPAAVLLTGDVSADGAPREYERARELLAPLRLPVHPLPGNHDDREALAAAFGLELSSGFVQYTARAGDMRLVLCDTIVPGSDGGDVCPARLAWIASELASDRETPTLLAMHHPPLLTGVPAMDEIGLAPAARAALADLVAPAENVLRIVAGHVHRAMVAELGGRSVFSCPSSDVAVSLDLTGGDLRMVDEPPAFALHVLADGGVTTLVQPLS
jgi:3',5'-cyclic AMP phosphodiesterase CpdA